ncbi:UNVERIFIED_CONTAM: Vacuolar protein sorting-associated protein 41, partial [Siphonaria sp. JEL0065]
MSSTDASSTSIPSTSEEGESDQESPVNDLNNASFEDNNGQSSNEDELEDEDEEEEENDEEPVLKYQRLSGILADTLKKDAVSTMSVSDRFLALGTHWGVVHILDMSGNNVKRFECHFACVNDISIDTSGEFVASASDDGKVVINSLYTPEVFPFKHKRPIKCVALEPDYSRKPSRNYVSGGTGEELTLTGKGWFSSVDTVIGSGEGAIWAVQWRNNYIAWANDAGVKLYDVTTSQKFAYIDRPPGSPRADLYRCNLCWQDDETLMIGWADSVKIGVIKDRVKTESVLGTTAMGVSVPSKFVEIVCEFRTDFIVSGIAPLRGQIVLLSFISNLEETQDVDVLATSGRSAPEKLLSNPPEIHVVDMDGEHVANDILSLFGYEHYRANDYRLAFLPSSSSPLDTTFYIVSPKDIVVAKPRDLDDHIEFL